MDQPLFSWLPFLIPFHKVLVLDDCPVGTETAKRLQWSSLRLLTNISCSSQPGDRTGIHHSLKWGYAMWPPPANEMSTERAEPSGAVHRSPCSSLHQLWGYLCEGRLWEQEAAGYSEASVSLWPVHCRRHRKGIHPSVVIWGLFVELVLTEAITSLSALAKQL